MQTTTPQTLPTTTKPAVCTTMSTSLIMSEPHSTLIPYTKLLFAASTGLFLGSTTWASVAVMPSLLAAPLSTHAKLSVFAGLIRRAGAILPPIFVSTVGCVAYLSYAAPLQSSRRAYTFAGAAMAGSAALQAVVLPRNKAMLEVVQQGRGKVDHGEEADWRIGELLKLNWIRVILGGVAFGLGLVELTK